MWCGGQAIVCCCINLFVGAVYSLQVTEVDCCSFGIALHGHQTLNGQSGLRLQRCTADLQPEAADLTSIAGFHHFSTVTGHECNAVSSFNPKRHSGEYFSGLPSADESLLT